MAIANIEDVVSDMAELEVEYRERRAALMAERDAYVRDALGMRVAVSALRAATGLSRTRLYRLRDDAYPEQR